MRSTTKTAIVLLFVFGLSSCAASMRTYEAPDPLQGVQTFKATRERTWTACVGSFAESGSAIQVVEKESGLITTQMAIFADGFSAERDVKKVATLPRNATPFAVWEAGRYSVNLHVISVTDSTTMVRVTPHIEAFDGNIGRRWYVCTSNGEIEAQIFRQIEGRLQR